LCSINLCSDFSTCGWPTQHFGWPTTYTYMAFYIMWLLLECHDDIVWDICLLMCVHIMPVFEIKIGRPFLTGWKLYMYAFTFLLQTCHNKTCVFFQTCQIISCACQMLFQTLCICTYIVHTCSTIYMYRISLNKNLLWINASLSFKLGVWAL